MRKIKYEILTENIFKGEEEKYFYFYCITNLKSNKKYWGVHSTVNLDDGYKGSGYALIAEMKTKPLSEYKKEILKFFKTKEEMYSYEESFVTKEVAKDKMTYNQHTGGNGSWDFTIGRVTVKDSEGNCFLVDKDDKRYLNGELEHNMVGLVHVIDIETNEHITISKEKYHNNKDRYKPHIQGHIQAIANGVKKWIPKEEYYEQNKLGLMHGHTKGKGVFKDKNGKNIMCDLNDPRVLSGELVGSTKGLTMYKYKNDFSKTCQTTANDPRVLSGELVGINYGIVFCINPISGEKLKTTKNDERLKTGEIWPMTKYIAYQKKLKGEKVGNKKILNKKDYYQMYQNIIDLCKDNIPRKEISKLTGYTIKKINYIWGRFKKAPED